VTPFAASVEGFYEGRLSISTLQAVAFRASLILRRFVLQSFAVFIHMVTFGAIIDSGNFIVFIMIEDGWGSLWIFKNRIVNEHHILLSPASSDDQSDSNQEKQSH
jgi:hypothetical protein